MIFCWGDWWPWTKPAYITMTRRQRNIQWIGSVAAHPAPKYSECKNPLKKSSHQFFEGIKTASSSLIIFQWPRLSSRSITYLCWWNWRTLWRKIFRGNFTKVVSFLHENAPAHRTLATQKKLAYLCCHCLDHPLCSPDLAPSQFNLFTGLKNNLKFAIFRPTRRSLLPRRPDWTDNILNFFEWLAKGRATD